MAVRMHLHNRRVQRHRLDADADDLLALHLLENRIQHAALRPSIHARVDRMPAAEPLRQAAPFAALLGHVQNSVQHHQVRQFHVAALHRQHAFDSLILRFRDLHREISLTENNPLV